MSEIIEQIEWLKRQFSSEAKKVRTNARERINYTYYKRVIENTKRKHPNDPLLDGLDVLLFEFYMLAEEYNG
ncbi:hypothetical protein [Aliivibrio logei]|uniref:Phage protein n=1 Tax=Aliivibrio logei TaxID=688 RepID=A0A1B9NW25_ALILO|nr:hypothetical protein [Aliivibrio logei]OCH19259.1 hypothetical protein A6E04_16835 [Aliivibrio logei]